MVCNTPEGGGHLMKTVEQQKQDNINYYLARGCVVCLGVRGVKKVNYILSKSGDVS